MMFGHTTFISRSICSSGTLRISKIPPCLASTRKATFSPTLVVTVTVTVLS